MTRRYPDAEQRYEASGRRPGRQILLRLPEALYARLDASRRRGEALATAVKRLLAEALRLPADSLTTTRKPIAIVRADAGPILGIGRDLDGAHADAADWIPDMPPAAGIPRLDDGTPPGALAWSECSERLYDAVTRMGGNVAWEWRGKIKIIDRPCP